MFLVAADELEAGGCDDVVGPLLEAAAALLGQDRAAALAALRAARATLVR